MSEEKQRRVQRKRTRGWKAPKGAVYVGRGSRWGNPFTVAEHGREDALRKYRALLEQAEPAFHERLRRELGGKNLMCWCSIDQKCHADILLEMANQ